MNIVSNDAVSKQIVKKYLEEIGKEDSLIVNLTYDEFIDKAYRDRKSVV